ncbi:uncharacterized protein EDB91DRAFT_1158301 [Suillus paluster]|uniref:uncharacterized protein n=1 Tax=Suillus paluster TaxID=48578 RepID=UPI001B87A9DF|nr:uncharacterized protein EDB91DRAFT_1158301 [Suillus paluster]KAG1729957.1 hypothetical protein EDB91DRAFT_1158301 [Suillus paluster]
MTFPFLDEKDSRSFYRQSQFGSVSLSSSSRSRTEQTIDSDMTHEFFDKPHILNVLVDYRQQTTEVGCYVRVASTAVWILDYFLTLDQEVHFFTTKKGWSMAHVLFVLARYMPAVSTGVSIYNDLSPSLDESQCVVNYKVSDTALFLVMMASEGLLLMRALALWHDCRPVKVTLLVLYTIVVMTMLACHIASASLMSAICTTSTSNLKATALVTHLVLGIFCSVYFFELVIVISTIIHAVRLRSTGRLVKALTHGSLFYVSVLLVISTVNITLFVLPLQDGETAMLDLFEIVLHGTLACRIFFQLRKACERQGDFGTTAFGSGMHFASDAMPLNTLRSLEP